VTGDGGVPGLHDTVRHPDKTTAVASAERMKLASSAQSLELAVDMAETIEARDSIERSLAHQLAVTHRLHMRLADRVNREIDTLNGPVLQPGAAVELARLVNAQARLADAFQRGVLTLAGSGPATARRSPWSTNTSTSRGARLP
jgi:hypothetical protein